MSEAIEVPAAPPAAISRITVAARELLATAEHFDVTDQDSLDFASSEYNVARESLKTGRELRMAVRRPILRAAEEQSALFDPALEMLERASELLNDKITGYLKRLEVQRAEATNKAKEAERVERARIASEAAALEQKAREDAARLRAEAAAHSEAGNDSAAGQLVKEADRAELGGHQAAQEQIALVAQVNIAAAVPAPVLRGITAPRARYYVEVTDLAALLRAVLDGRAPLAYVEARVEVINRSANALRDEFQCDGCVLKTEHAVARTRRKP